MSNGWQRDDSFRSWEAKRLPKYLLIALGFGAILVIVGIGTGITPVWWCFLVGYVVAVGVWLAVRYIFFPEGLPPWFRLKNDRDDQEAHHVRVLLRDEPVIDNPTDPNPLAPHMLHDQILLQGQAQSQIRVVVKMQAIDPEQGGAQELGWSTSLVDEAGNAVGPQMFDCIEATLLPGPEDKLLLYAQWRDAAGQAACFERTLTPS